MKKKSSPLFNMAKGAVFLTGGYFCYGGIMKLYYMISFNKKFINEFENKSY
jgi:hypothetical protein